MQCCGGCDLCPPMLVTLPAALTPTQPWHARLLAASTADSAALNCKSHTHSHTQLVLTSTHHPHPRDVCMPQALPSAPDAMCQHDTHHCTTTAGSRRTLSACQPFHPVVPASKASGCRGPARPQAVDHRQLTHKPRIGFMKHVHSRVGICCQSTPRHRHSGHVVPK